jgi:eukaryotic-like serine/threonine-protein kinase
MSVSAGARLGPYEIQSLIGAGGMGEVYQARDTRLDRSVALKVLRREVSADPERRARFEREAKTVASLNHPHIVTLHSVEEDAGVRFLTMELVEGEGLDQLLTAPRAFPWRRSLPSASPSPTRSLPPTRKASSTATSSRPT